MGNSVWALSPTNSRSAPKTVVLQSGARIMLIMLLHWCGTADNICAIKRRYSRFVRRSPGDAALSVAR